MYDYFQAVRFFISQVCVNSLQKVYFIRSVPGAQDS